MKELIRYEKYSRRDIHNVFSPDTNFTPQTGSWGLHGIIRVSGTDVFTYCIQMAMKLNVNPEDIILKKLDKTIKKYPVEKAKGVSTTYNKL